MLESLFQYTFLQNALWSALLASIACGIIGSLVVEKKLVMMSGGIAHTAFGGIGLGYYLGIEPMVGALAFALAAALGIPTIQRRTDTGTDVLIGLFWSLGMALGIIFIAFTPGYPPDMTSYLFGDILTVTRGDLYIMLALDLVIVITVLALFNLFKAYLFDEEFSFVMGVNTTFLEYLLFILMALTVVILIRVVGIILVIALLSGPPAIARKFSRDFKKVMLYAILLGAFFCLAGLWLSYELNIASGASIILLTGAGYALAQLRDGS